MTQELSTEAANWKLIYKKWDEKKIVFLTKQQADGVNTSKEQKKDVHIKSTWDYVKPYEIENLKEIDNFDYDKFTDKIIYFYDKVLSFKWEMSEWVRWIYRIDRWKKVMEKGYEDELEKTFYVYFEWENEWKWLTNPKKVSEEVVINLQNIILEKSKDPKEREKLKQQYNLLIWKRR